eukprot:Pgem_evm1s8738
MLGHDFVMNTLMLNTDEGLVDYNINRNLKSKRKYENEHQTSINDSGVDLDVVNETKRIKLEERRQQKEIEKQNLIALMNEPRKLRSASKKDQNDDQKDEEVVVKK